MSTENENRIEELRRIARFIQESVNEICESTNTLTKAAQKNKIDWDAHDNFIDGIQGLVGAFNDFNLLMGKQITYSVDRVF